MIVWLTQALEPDVDLKPSRGFFYGWLFGVGLFGAGASWIYVSIHNFGNASPALAGSLTLIWVIGLAIVPGLAFWLHFRLRTQSYAKNALLFIAIWTLTDEFRTEFLTGFPWLFLGYSHLESPLAGWIPVLGVYGVGAIVVATGITLTLWLTNATTRVKSSFFAMLCLIWLTGPALNQINWSHAAIPEQDLSVALVQLNIPQKLKWQPSQRRKTLKLLDQLSQQNWQSDLIVWPETAVPLLYDQAKPFLDRIGEHAEKNNSNIITGVPFRKINKDTGRNILHNSIASLGSGSGVYHKQKLVPFGEYIPLQDLLRGLIDFFNLPMSDFRKGAKNQPLLSSHQYKVAPFICYEVVYPDFVAERAKNADYLLTISNDAWFGESIAPIQHLQMAQVRAAENAKYMVRGTNNGISAVIDERGRIIDQSEQFVETVLESKFKIMQGRTPFSVTGSMPLFLLCGVWVLLVWVPFRRKSYTEINRI
jgi:apolipoprotein N-acyltransferase